MGSPQAEPPGCSARLHWICSWMTFGGACLLWFTLLPSTYYILRPFPHLLCWPLMEIESALPATSCLPCSSLSGLKAWTRLSKPNLNAIPTHAPWSPLFFGASHVPHRDHISTMSPHTPPPRLSGLCTCVTPFPQDWS